MAFTFLNNQNIQGTNATARPSKNDRFSGGLFSDLMDIISIPQGQLIGAIKGISPGEAYKKKQSFTDITGDEGWGKAAGTALDIVADPINLVPAIGVASKLSKGFKASAAATKGLKTAQAIAKATTKKGVAEALGKSSANLSDDALKALAKEKNLAKIGKIAKLDMGAIIRPDDTAIEAVAKAAKSGQYKAGQRAKMISQQKSSRLASSNLEKATDPWDYLKKLRAGQKGEMATPEIAPLQNILSKSQMDELGNMARYTDGLGAFEKGNVLEALQDMYQYGKLPAKSVLKKMELVYGQGFTNAIKRMGNVRGGLLDNIVALPRAIKSSMDISMGGRQGLVVAARNPKEWAIANKLSIKYLANPKAYADDMAKISKQAAKNGAQKHGLAIKAAHGGLEETGVYAGAELAESLPGIGRGVKASERAYNGGLAKLRMSLWEKNVKYLQKAGKKLASKDLDDLAEVINTMTGVGGKKGGFLAKHATTLNQTLFSPRLWAARLQPFNPKFWKRLSPAARKVAFENMASFAGLVGTTLTAVTAAGGKVETNPTSADFLKVRVGDTRYDILGGFQQNIVFAARQVMNQTKSSTTGRVTKYGEQYGGPTRKTALFDLVQNKMNPSLSFGLQALEGKNRSFEEFKMKEELQKLFVPLSIEGTAEAFDEEGAIGAVKSIPEYLGIGAQTYSGGRSQTARKKGSSGGGFSFLKR